MSRTGEGETRVLIPVDEQERRVTDALASAYIDPLLTVDPDMPVRYDPLPHAPRRQPEPRYFHSGDGRRNSRTYYTRGRYPRFSRFVLAMFCLSASLSISFSDKVRHSGPKHLNGSIQIVKRLKRA